MLDPQTQNKIKMLVAHYNSMGKIISELTGETPKTNSRVKKLSAEEEAEIKAKIRSKINS